jgi:hypothetical protein
MNNDNALLLVATILGAAAYILVEAAASGDESTPTSSGAGSMKGFAINNPGNIRYLATNAFAGQTGNSGGYGVYAKLSDGVHAMYEELTKYYNSGLKTITQIVSKWAPSSENDTEAYIDDVSERMNESADTPLSWPDDAAPLIQAMSWHENGYNPMTDDDVEGYIA